MFELPILRPRQDQEKQPVVGTQHLKVPKPKEPQIPYYRAAEIELQLLQALLRFQKRQRQLNLKIHVAGLL